MSELIPDFIPGRSVVEIHSVLIPALFLFLLLHQNFLFSSRSNSDSTTFIRHDMRCSLDGGPLSHLFHELELPLLIEPISSLLEESRSPECIDASLFFLLLFFELLQVLLRSSLSQ